MKKPTRIILLSILSMLCVVFSLSSIYTNAETVISNNDLNNDYISTATTKANTIIVTESEVIATTGVGTQTEATETTATAAVTTKTAVTKSTATKSSTSKTTTKAAITKVAATKTMTEVSAITHTTASNAVPAKAPTAASYNGLFLWPVPTSKNYNSCFGDGRHHNGLDIKSSMSGSVCDNVVAVYKGTVDYISNTCTHNYPKTNNFCGCGGGLGNFIRIKHIVNGKTYYTYYGHLSKILVSKNSAVSKGQVIGKIGSTGNSFGYHLHFKIANSEKVPLDPFFGVTSDNTTTTPLSTGKKFLLTIPKGLYCSADGTKDTCCKRYRERIQYIYGITVPQK